MSLLSAVRAAEAYEGLANYVTARGPPGAVGAPPPYPGQEVAPAGAVPPGKRPLPNSSQKPWQQTNARIPYARHSFTWPRDMAAPRNLVAGDVAMVHKTSASLGRGTNRCVKTTGLPQLNEMLANNKTPGYATLDLNDPGCQQRIVRARQDFFAALIKTFEHSGLEARSEYAKMKTALADLSKAAFTPPDIQPATDWPAVQLLADWTPDGVVINTDWLEKDDSDDGVLLNVAVQGPTPTNNDAKGQLVDARLLALDKVFVGLVAIEKDSTHFEFRYRLFSSAHLQRPLAEDDDARRLVGAWKLGSVMDTLARIRQDDEPEQIEINVAIEWWRLDQLQKEYNAPLGTPGAPRSYSIGDLIDKPSAPGGP